MYSIISTSRFWPRWRAPVFLSLLTRQMGRCGPPTITALMLLIHPQK
jgi:hypothetical protein